MNFDDVAELQNDIEGQEESEAEDGDEGKWCTPEDEIELAEAAITILDKVKVQSAFGDTADVVYAALNEYIEKRGKH